MSDANEDRIDGMTDKAKGSAKEGLGEIRDDEDQQAEGKMDQSKGGLKEKMGDAKDKANEVMDKFKNDK